MAANEQVDTTASASTVTGADAKKADANAGIARVRRLGLDPSKIGEADAERLRHHGIDSDTFERKAVTYKGLMEEFGKPIGPRLYNDIAVAAFGGVPSNRADLSIMTLQDDYIMPRGRDESDEAFNARLQKHRARRKKVEHLIAEAEGGNS
jgi:hypothetical protein